jgi:serine protease Do
MRSVVLGVFGYAAGVASVIGVLATPSVLNAQQGKQDRFWREGVPPVTSKEAPAAPAAPATQLPSLSGLVKAVAPSVVFIRVSRPHPQVDARRFPGLPPGMVPPEAPDDDFHSQGGGSGFVISEDGYIVTNNHVIQDADEITVYFKDGHEYKAKVVGRDPQVDVGLIKIEAKGLPVTTLGDSDKQEPGDWVLAMGNPLGLEYSASVGIVSGLGRRIGIGRYDALLQTDAAINPGNSGGPLFNLKGEVIGINTAIIGGANAIGFAVPINMAKEVLPDLKQFGRAIRGQLGVQLAPISEDTKNSLGLKSTDGVYLQRVFANRAADKAGLKPGDVILEFEGQPVKDMRDLQMRVARARPGADVKLTYLRDGKRQVANAKLTEFEEEGLLARAPDEEEGSKQQRETTEKVGIAVKTITPDVMARYSLASPDGVVVVRVQPNSPADDAELKEGDTLVAVMVDGKWRKISDAKQFQKVVQDTGNSSLLLKVRREGNEAAVELRPRRTSSTR